MRTELIGGLTTFLTLVYIVFVNPSILSGRTDLDGARAALRSGSGRHRVVWRNPHDSDGVFGRYPFVLAAGLGLNAFAAAEVAAHRVNWAR